MLSSTCKQLFYMGLHCIFLCITIKPEIVIFECPWYSWIKEEKLLKIWDASDWEISFPFWENTGPFFIGNGAEIRPQKQPCKNPCITKRQSIISKQPPITTININASMVKSTLAHPNVRGKEKRVTQFSPCSWHISKQVEISTPLLTFFLLLYVALAH